MIKRLITIVAMAIAAVSCSRVQTRSLSSPNPTTYSFPLPLEQVYAKAFEAFSIEHQIDQPIFGRQPPGFESVLSAECVTNAVFGEAVFRDPANANDIYLHSFHSPFVTSSVYFGGKGDLPFIATFHLHLTRAGSNTAVTVTASDAQIVNGTKFGVGSCGPGQGNNYVNVKPTTVEEYSLLRYLGNHLGFTNMPALMLPK